MIVWRLFCVVLVISIGLLGFGIWTLATARGGLDKVPAGYSFGPDDADLTVVAFMDYGCVHCREAHPVILDAVQQDGKIRYIPRLVATPGTSGIYATKLTYAAGLQGKFKEAFREMMENSRPVDEKSVLDIALKIGADAEKLKADAESPEVKRLMDQSATSFVSIGAKYTPSFFIGPTIKYIPATPPTTQDFAKMFSEARRK